MSIKTEQKFILDDLNYKDIDNKIIPSENEIIVAIQKAKIITGNTDLKFNKNSFNIREIDFPKRKKTTLGVYLITITDLNSGNFFSIISKGIRQGFNHNSIPHEASILQDPSFNTSKNPLNPPCVYHCSIDAESTWIFMEYISKTKPVSSWNEKDIQIIATSIGRFNGQFSRKNISTLKWVTRPKIIHIALNAYSAGIRLLKTLHNAGTAGYSVALKAAKLLETFMNHFPKKIHWLSRQNMVLCHNDLGPGENIFIDLKYRPRTIDWQNCGLSFLGFDPAWTIWKLQKAGEEQSFFCEKNFLEHYREGLRRSGLNAKLSDVKLSIAICYALIIIKRQLFMLQWRYTIDEGQPRHSFTDTFHKTVVHPLNNVEKLDTATENFIKKLEIIN